ncbi:MAG: hypothetical protein HQ481_07450 [Alphaproteobacteria bacterium]|nr:hypothetical protein [Alphaproteobacteria bacterium]
MTTGRVRVVVATTEGPAEIRRITAEDPSLRSVICLAGTSQALPISNAYDAFVRAPTGMIERAVGHPAFRVDVDRPIGDGESWQLGLYLAHRLKAAGRLAEDGAPADGVLWATGRVDHDGRIGSVGRIDVKLRRSGESWRPEAAPVLAIVPVADREQIEEGAAPAGFELLPVDQVDMVIQHLGLGIPRPVRAGPPWRFVGGLAAAGVVAIVLVLSPADVGIEPPPAVEAPLPASTRVASPPTAAFEPMALRLALEEKHAQTSDAGCAGAGTLAAVEPGAETVAGVCALRWSVANTGAVSAHVWLYAVVEGAFREYASRTRSSGYAAGRLEPGAVASVTVAPPSWLRRAATVRAILVVAAGERPQIDQVFTDIDLASADDLDRKVAGLIDLGVHVVDRRHRLIPSLR